jgi:hypothetical protein
LWKKLAFSVVVLCLFFALLEGGLSLVGVRSELLEEDPFVGFVSSIPLFVEETGTDGAPVLVTNTSKRGFFNVQRFPREKAAGTYRAFCLGGSTTYGRPYSDTTSFSRWLRELLPLADSDHRWEIINCGGISYASYRVASLVEELVRYEPDLFVVYSGHNEFLEERTYGDLRDIPGAAKTAVALLARTRTWKALSLLIDRVRPAATSKPDTRSLLPDDVKAKLDHSAGLTLYHRDDELSAEVLSHYGFSLQRIVALARSAEAEVIFVTPASNLKDFSPFKSQHTDGLAESKRTRSEELHAAAQDAMRESRWSDALEALEEALVLDPRYADLHYDSGKALLRLDRHEDAEAAFERARDEDVCPLRALSSMQVTLAEIAHEAGAPLVDFADLLKHRTRSRLGHGIAGEEYFLDHVHPTIEGTPSSMPGRSPISH